MSERVLGYYPDVEISDEIRIGAHKAIRSGYSNGNYCRALLGWVTSVYLDGAGRRSVTVQCQGCEYSASIVVADDGVASVR